MLRKLIYLIFIISIGCNIYVAFDYYRRLQDKRFGEAFIENTKLKNIGLGQGNDFLFNKIKNLYPEYQKNKKYYLISIWNILCKPCVKEMPLLDSLADNANRKDLGCIFLTENGDKIINQFLKKHHISSKNFIFINDADTYISSVLKRHNLKNRQYPIQLIIDNKGNDIYFQTGTIDSSKDSLVLNCIKNMAF